MRRIVLRRACNGERVAFPLAHIATIEEPLEGNPIGAFVRTIGGGYAHEVKETFDEIARLIEAEEMRA